MAEHNQARGAVDVAALLRNLATRLSEFCGQGSYAYLLDRPTTVAPDSPLVVFDTRRCPADVLRPVMFAVMEYVTRTVERHWATRPAEATGRYAGRSVMLIDEAWHVVGRAQTGEYANDLARRARHLGLVLIVMSQQLSDFDTEHGLALLQNSTMQMLLAQHPNELPFIRSALQLSDEEARLVGRLKTSRAATRSCCGSTEPAAAAASPCASARRSTGALRPTRVPTRRCATPSSPSTPTTRGPR